MDAGRSFGRLNTYNKDSGNIKTSLEMEKKNVLRALGLHGQQLKQEYTSSNLEPKQLTNEFNTDRGCNLEAAGGGVIRNHLSELVCAFGNSIADAIALRLQLELYGGKFQPVWVELDSEVVVRILNRKNKGHWESKLYAARHEDVMQSDST
ncbi:Uncharacterized protein Adt_21345 [Abeliophyllum distichum]|uniref:RNase H type-1 domain-containing protein n=1 Tax=Abeliophyllum distichum TaxID=126358 RepID=A0ABD1SZ61_9LAMI